MPGLLCEDTWDHCEFFQWQLNAFYSHLHRLADTVASTKENLEDNIGEVGRLTAKNTNFQSPERTFFCTATSKRLCTTDRKFILPTTDELCAASGRVLHAKGEGLGNRSVIFGESSVPTVAQAKTVHTMRELCRAGG